MARQLLVLLACAARVAVGRLGSGANLTQTSFCGKQGDVCADGTGCKCDDHGGCACTQRCGSSGFLCDFGQECSCGDYGSCNCVDKPSCSADQQCPLGCTSYNSGDVDKFCCSGTHHLDPDDPPLSYVRYGLDLLFRCNLCGERFSENSVLLNHLKQRHLAVSRALKPQYSCGQCPARFFKNSFLVKHSSTHAQTHIHT